MSAMWADVSVWGTAEAPSSLHMNQGGCDLQILAMHRGKYGNRAAAGLIQRGMIVKASAPQVRAARHTTPHTDPGAESSVGFPAP